VRPNCVLLWFEALCGGARGEGGEGGLCSSSNSSSCSTGRIDECDTGDTGRSGGELGEECAVCLGSSIQPEGGRGSAGWLSSWPCCEQGLEARVRGGSCGGASGGDGSGSGVSKCEDSILQQRPLHWRQVLDFDAVLPADKEGDGLSWRGSGDGVDGVFTFEAAFDADDIHVKLVY